MLIIEGADCVGKTTLAYAILQHSLILDRVPAIYGHWTVKPPRWNYSSHYLACLNVWFTVQDRGWMSEQAYSPITRGQPSRVSQEQCNVLDAKNNMTGGLTVVLTAEPDLIADRFKPERELFSLQQVLQVNTWYLNHTSKKPWMVYHRFERDDQNLSSLVEKLAQMWVLHLQEKGMLE